MNLLLGVPLDVTVELGSTRMNVREILKLGVGSVVELDRTAGSAVDLLVNEKIVARGEVVAVDDNFGIRVTELVTKLPL